MSISIEVSSLSFSYGSSKILKNISFNIDSGAFLSIIGSNGSGKSTLLKNISSILKPDYGEVKIGGININKMSSKKIAQNIAVVPQSTTIEFNFSAMDIVLMGRNPYKNRFESENFKDYKIVKKAMELTDTWQFKDRLINELSGGERQRVVIARALAQEPKIILLDEPTSYLDIQHQIEILELLWKLNKEDNLTVVTVLHDINLAARFSDCIVLLKEGKIINEGVPEEVITLENLKKAYEIDMVISKNPYTKTPHMIPLSKSRERMNRSQTKVHILCGGGTGSEIIQNLHGEGYSLSAGVLNIGDSDWELCNICDIKAVEEAPFTNISEESHRKNLNIIKQSDFVILTSIPIGSGNIKNLEAIEYAIDIGKKVLFLNNYNNQYDFTKGLGREKLRKIKKSNICECKSVEEVLSIIKTNI